MLEPSFLSKVAELTYIDPKFELLPFRAHSSDAMFRVMIAHSVDLLYPTLGVSSFASLVVEAYTSFYLLNCIVHVWQVILVSVKRFKLLFLGFSGRD